MVIWQRNGIYDCWYEEPNMESVEPLRIGLFANSNKNRVFCFGNVSMNKPNDSIKS